MRALLACGLIAAAVAFSLPAEAQDEQRGVVLEFEGRGHSRVRGYVVQALRSRADLVPVRDATRAAQDAGEQIESREGIRAAAAELDIDFAIAGEVTGTGRRARAQLRIYNADGEEIGTRGARARPGASGRRSVGAAARRLLRDASDELTAAAARRAEEERRRREEEEEEERRREEEENAEEEEEEDDGPTAEHPLPRLRALVGIQARDRVATVNFGDAVGERGYNSSFHPELGVRLESFPFGNSEGAGQGMYLELDFFHSVSLSTIDVDGSEVDTSAWRLRFGLGYLFPIADDLVRFGPIVGFGIDTFSLGENTILRTTKYSQLRAGLSANIRLYQNLLRLRIDAAYRYLFGVGDDFADDFGEDTSGWALDMSATIEGQTGMFTYGLNLGFVRYGLSFSGEAAVPEAQAVDEFDGSDRSFFLSILLGIAFE